MASNPSTLVEYPWKWLGNFKYVVLAPIVVHNIHSFFTSKEEGWWDSGYLLLWPLMLLRMLHTQMWISLNRYKTAKGENRILDISIEFDQPDKERNWDDSIIFTALIFYCGYLMLEQTHNLPIWRTDGIILTALVHIGPVEFLYYWLHRSLHRHYLYSRYHSHHHSSIVTEPTAYIFHPFSEQLAYFMLFGIPMLTSVLTGTASVTSLAGYITYVDCFDMMGHCNFEIIPKWMFSIFPPLRYLMITATYHSLHHTHYRTNYALFVPIYDSIYGTLDKSTNILYEKSRERKGEFPDVVHLTHLTTLESIYHLRLGFVYLASKPYTSKWYFWLIWPITLFSMMVTWIYNYTFIVERNICKNLNLQTWAIPKYRVQYNIQSQRENINKLIEKAITEADQEGIKVLSLGLLNQEEELNKNGELYIRRYPQLKMKVVDGSSLAVAVVLNSIPKGTSHVVLGGHLSKVAYFIAHALCQRGVKVVTLRKQEYNKLKTKLTHEAATNLVPSECYASKTWIVGDRLSKEEQLKAPKGTLFIPFSPFPPKKSRKDCVYFHTPAMIIPKHLENVDSCENWLPRRVMSAWRIAGILHALEGWNEHECGDMIFDIDKVWKACLDHGFLPLNMDSTA